MAKPDFGRVLWFGAAPQPPPPPRFRLSLRSPLSRFRPYGLPIRDLVCGTSASQEFIRSTGVLVAATPEFIKPLLVDYGVAVAPVRDIYEVCEWSFYAGARGHGDRFTWAAISGLCKHEGHLLVLTEFAERDKRLYRAENRKGTFNHELGHCIDRALDHISQKPEFVGAWTRDVERLRSKLSPGQLMAFDYFTADGPQGPSETFAEILANQIGGGCLAYLAKDWPDIFPECYAFIQQLLLNLPSKSPVVKTA